MKLIEVLRTPFEGSIALVATDGILLGRRVMELRWVDGSLMSRDMSASKSMYYRCTYGTCTDNKAFIKGMVYDFWGRPDIASWIFSSENEYEIFEDMQQLGGEMIDAQESFKRMYT